MADEKEPEVKEGLTELEKATKKLDYFRDKSKKQDGKIDDALRRLDEALTRAQAAELKLAGLTNDRDELQVLLATSEDKVQKLSQERELAKPQADHVMLDGQLWPISRRLTVKDCIEEARRRHIQEFHTAIVIEKEGG